MKFRYKLVISALLGIVMGNILPHMIFYDFFTRSGLAMVPWSIIGAILCYFALNKKQSILMGMTYVIFVAESFLFLGQLKFNSELFMVLLFLGIVFVVSLICGLIMGLVVYYSKRWVRKLLK